MGFEKFLHGPGRGVRNGMVAGLQSQVLRQLKLEKLGLHPGGTIEDMCRSTVSLVTEGIVDGTIDMRRETEIVALAVRDGQRVAELSDGTTVPADVVVCGTGWKQAVPFLDARGTNIIPFSATTSTRCSSTCRPEWAGSAASGSGSFRSTPVMTPTSPGNWSAATGG